VAPAGRVRLPGMTHSTPPRSLPNPEPASEPEPEPEPASEPEPEPEPAPDPGTRTPAPIPPKPPPERAYCTPPTNHANAGTSTSSGLAPPCRAALVPVPCSSSKNP
jgi:hypothetical protein